jgi:hypothetical protein
MTIFIGASSPVEKPSRSSRREVTQPHAPRKHNTDASEIFALSKRALQPGLAVSWGRPMASMVPPGMASEQLRNEAARIQRLVRDNAGFAVLGLISAARAGTHDDETSPRLMLPRGPRDFSAIHDRHFEIGDDGVERRALERFERSLGCGERLHFPAFAGQERGQSRDRRRVILDDEHSRHDFSVQASSMQRALDRLSISVFEKLGDGGAAMSA